MTTSPGLLTAEALAQVGQPGEVRCGLVTAHDIARFCSGILEEGAEHFDHAAARALGHPGIVAPPTFAYATTRPAPPRREYLADGQYGFVAPPGLDHLQTMLGGQAWTFHRAPVVGEELEEHRTVLSMTEREGRTGPMALVRSQQAFVTPAGEPVETLVSTLILRPPPPPLAAVPVTPPAPQVQPGTTLPDAGPDQLVVQTDIIQSFLFNAAIWAVHRIHWDLPFARSEGLPATVLVGWNLAGFVARLGRRLAPPGKRLRHMDLSYRALAHPGDVLTVTAHDADAEGDRAVTVESSRGTTPLVGTMGWA